VSTIEFETPFAARQASAVYREYLDYHLEQLGARGMDERDAAHALALPRALFANDPRAIQEAGDAVAAGWPVLLDLGSTYGTIFRDDIRQDVAHARGEMGALSTVSVIARREDAMQWIDEDRLHPAISRALHGDKGALLERVGLFRFPANAAGRALGKHVVNEDGDIQMYFAKDDDPLMAYLREAHGIIALDMVAPHLASQPDEPFAPGALAYGYEIASPIVLIRSEASLVEQIDDQLWLDLRQLKDMKRQRVGAFPIVKLPSVNDIVLDMPVVRLLRAGSTHANTMKHFVHGVFPQAAFRYEEAAPAKRRMEYESPRTTAAAIAADLLRASRWTDV
jgi:hypothetical protein